MTGTLLIIRHAERPAIQEGTVGSELPLTTEGIRQTTRFAQSISSKIASIETSPILRCTQTADIIVSIHGLSINSIQHSRMLGDPGFFIEDAELAWENWVSKGVDAVNQHLLTGTTTWPGFRDFDSAIEGMWKKIENTLTANEEGVHLWVTHDTILATLSSRLQRNPLTMADWPDYLGGLVVMLDHNGDYEISYSSSFNPKSSQW